MKFKPKVYEIPIDVFSEKYSRCQVFIDENKAKNPIYRQLTPDMLYISECFTDLSDKIFDETKKFRNCKKFKIGDVYDDRAEHIYSFGDDNHSVQILKDFDEKTLKPELFITYMPRSTFRWLFKPDYFKEILTQYRAEIPDKHDRDNIIESLTIEKILNRKANYH